MRGLTEEARVKVEKNIDEIIKAPKDYEDTYSFFLREMGIEPNLERLVSFFSGLIVGLIQQFYHQKYDRGLEVEEIRELQKLMKRRAFEIRMALMSSRVEE